ncbi:hypothetical protein KKI95_01965 [Xenorhabdus bovienii]|uniref:hypothetical protein n=1 Tax=Xenorhabdus bovienii TaxID=40576 RepID=UPI00237C76C7|nr:hypothetical protein [Xenorhabdus bovienii]MDE1481701.1 hypothetical protein [Xenorhabdus bovienii]MDE9434737.1 hypothetical protein [Xenorhabdus bovienii]MDE9440528.1 hypothetical protein [Xenorhabdus bovienii]MDE9496343.1 hypothetical protein [Xenorhabdus bovienii]
MNNMTYRQLVVSLINVQKRMFFPTLPDTLSHHVWSLLGWNTIVFERFLHAKKIFVTLPHASPNIFFPRAGVSKFVTDKQKEDNDIFHLRVVLTHTNFSDLGWRPYAWWYLDEEGILTKQSIFSRNKKKKHYIVASQSPLLPDKQSYPYFLNQGVQLAQYASNLSLSYIVLQAFQEQLSGFSLSNRTLYLPLDALVALMQTLAREEPKVHPWLLNLLIHAQNRVLNEHQLEFTHQWENAYVYDNYTNISLLFPLAPTAVVGGVKMQRYWSHIVDNVTSINEKIATPYLIPQCLVFPQRKEYLLPYIPKQETLRQIQAADIEYSLAMAIVEHQSYTMQ